MKPEEQEPFEKKPESPTLSISRKKSKELFPPNGYTSRGVPDVEQCFLVALLQVFQPGDHPARVP